MSVEISRLTNAAVYLDGEGFIARASGVTLPEVKAVESDHPGLGLFGKLMLPGGIDAMEAKIRFNAPYAIPLAKVCNPYKAVRLQVRASIDVWDTSQGLNRKAPLVATLTALGRTMGGLDVKQHDKAEIETTWNVLKFRLEIDGEEVLNADPMNFIHEVGGVDVLTQERANLGL